MNEKYETSDLTLVLYAVVLFGAGLVQSITGYSLLDITRQYEESNSRAKESLIVKQLREVTNAFRS